jgi:hypothetical protein
MAIPALRRDAGFDHAAARIGCFQHRMLPPGATNRKLAASSYSGRSSTPKAITRIQAKIIAQEINIRFGGAGLHLFTLEEVKSLAKTGDPEEINDLLQVKRLVFPIGRIARGRTSASSAPPPTQTQDGMIRDGRRA